MSRPAPSRSSAARWSSGPVHAAAPVDGAVRTGAGPSGPARDSEGDDRPWWRNEVHLVGTLTTRPERRTLPSGDELLVLTVTVGRPQGTTVDAVPVRFGPAPPPGRRPTAEQCGRRRLAEVERLEAGARVEVRGSLRRRWWRSATGATSRVEVAATSIDGVALAPAGASEAPVARS